MYDSENISLVTRIEAGTGVTVTHATNSEGENVWTAQIDQTWLTNWVNANSAGALKLNDSDEARLRAVEDALGIVPEPSTPPAPSVPSGATGTTEVTVSGAVSVLTDDITMTYSLTGLDGTNLVSETLQGTDGATPTQVLMAIYSQMKRNNGMLRFMTPTYDFTNSKLVLTWNDANVGSTFTYSIAAQGAGDNIVFTATDY
jgi:hypothetical protein